MYICTLITRTSKEVKTTKSSNEIIISTRGQIKHFTILKRPKQNFKEILNTFP